MEVRKKYEPSMTVDMTNLATEELKQTAKLTAQEYSAINRRIQQLPERVSVLTDPWSLPEKRSFLGDLP